MEREHQKTLMTTIRVHLKRNEKGKVEWTLDPNGKWKIVAPSRTTSGLIKYFTPIYNVGVDSYGAIKANDNE